MNVSSKLKARALQLDDLAGRVALRPWLSLLIYIAIMVAATGFFLVIASLMTQHTFSP